MAKKEIYRIEIPIETQDVYSDGLRKAKSDVKQFEKSVENSARKSTQHMSRYEKAVNKTVERINQRMDRLTKGRWSMTLRAVDHASRVIRNVSLFAQRVTGRTYRIAVRTLDYATRPLRGIVNSMTSILGTVGIVGGVAGGFVMPIKLTMDRQNVTTAFEVLLGSAEAADKRIRELTEFAGQTPYARDEIYEASRILEIFTKGALSTGDGLRLVGDIAAGTQQEFGDVALWIGRLYDAMAAGRPVGEMTSRLQEMGAISGDARARIEALAESGEDITKIWPEVTKEFSRYDGMMSKLSDNLANLLLGVKTSFTNNVLMRWGQGMANALQPALSRFRDWRNENAEAIEAMGDAIERYGERFMQFIVDKVETGFSYINELFFTDKYSDLTFGAKVRLMIDDARDAFNEWWEATGRSKVTGLTGKMGTALGETLNGAILGVLGIETGESSGFVSAGFEAGSSFVKGFIDGFDAGEVAKAIMKKIADINIEGAKGAFQGDFGGLITAGIVDMLLLGAAAKLLSGPAKAGKALGKLGKGAFDITKGAAGWLWGHTFGRGKGSKGTTTPAQLPSQKTTQRTQTHSQKMHTQTQQKPPVIVDHRGRPITSQTPPQQTTPVKTPKSKFPKIKLPKGVSAIGKRLPVIGTALGALSLVGSTKEELPGAVGSLAGGLGGAALGASLGSFVPVVGTAAGGIIGGIAGAFGGEKLGGWLGNLFGIGKGKATASVAEAGATGGGAFLQMQQQASVITQNLQALATWTAQASNWIVGAFQPIQNVGVIINHNVMALSTWLAQASAWVVGAFSPLQGQGQLTTHNLTALNTWLAQSSAWVVDAFMGIQNGGMLVNHNLSALAVWLGQSSGWVVGAFMPMQANGQLVQHNLSVLSTWVGQASGWVVSAFQPLQSAGALVRHNMSALATWLGRASGWVASINGIQTGATSVKSALNLLATRIRSVRVPTLPTPKIPGIPGYAKGTNYHPGGPAIVGDGGGPELIQYPSGKLALSPSTDTLLNLPKGTKVMPHHKTAKLIDVPAYEGGIGEIDKNLSASTSSTSNGTTIVYGDTSIGDTHVTVIVEGGDVEDPDDLAVRIADKVAGAIADKLVQVGQNMPV